MYQKRIDSYGIERTVEITLLEVRSYKGQLSVVKNYRSYEYTRYTGTAQMKIITHIHTMHHQHRPHHEVVYTNNWPFIGFSGEEKYAITFRTEQNRCAKPSGNLLFDYFFPAAEQYTIKCQIVGVLRTVNDFYLLDFTLHIQSISIQIRSK